MNKWDRELKEKIWISINTFRDCDAVWKHLLQDRKHQRAEMLKRLLFDVRVAVESAYNVGASDGKAGTIQLDYDVATKLLKEGDLIKEKLEEK